jgi:hypothetical protein
VPSLFGTSAPAAGAPSAFGGFGAVAPAGFTNVFAFGAPAAPPAAAFNFGGAPAGPPAAAFAAAASVAANAASGKAKSKQLKFDANPFAKMAAGTDSAPPPPPTIGSLAVAATADHALLSCVRRVCARAIAASVTHCVRMIDVMRQSAVNPSSGAHEARFLCTYDYSMSPSRLLCPSCTCLTIVVLIFCFV